jgi:hypothetical protein
MALTKETTTELIQVIGPFKTIEIRTTTRIKDDGVVVADNLHRDNIKIGDLNSKNELVATDISGQSAEIQAIAAAVWTDEVKEAYRKYLVDNLPEGFTP